MAKWVTLFVLCTWNYLGSIQTEDVTGDLNSNGRSVPTDDVIEAGYDGTLVTTMLSQLVRLSIWSNVAH